MKMKEKTKKSAYRTLRNCHRATIMPKAIVGLVILILISIGVSFLFFGEQKTIFVHEKEIRYTQSGVPYNALTYNGTELTDHRYIISEDLCVAENLGMNISIYPCNTRVFIAEDIENYVDFHWQGELEQNTSWVFVYEGTLESGEMSLGHDEIIEYTDYEDQEQWVNNYLVAGVIGHVDISPPTVEDCELGTENNTFMYHVTQQNETTYETNYCFSEFEQINETAFYVSGNASLSEAVLKNKTITVYDTPVEVEYLGYDLLGNEFQYYQVLNVVFEPDRTYKTKWSFTPQDHALSGKWHIFGFNAEHSLEESLDLGQYIYVDPSWTSNFNLGLVAYYQMNDTTGNGTDAVFADNNVTVFNNTVNRGLTGIVNGSYYFGGTGDDFADVTDIASMNSTTGTFAFWYNWTNFTVNLQYAFRFSDEVVGNHLYALFDARVGAPLLTICCNIGGGACDWRIDIGLKNISEGTWQHLVVTQNGTGGNLYINGTLLGTSTGASQDVWIRNLTNAGGINRLRLGAGYDGTLNYRGHLDEMAIWNRSLTASEVSDLYNSGTGIFYDPDVGLPSAENVSVALDYPTDNFVISLSIINFTATLTPTDINNTNATLYLWNSTNVIINDTTNLVTGAVPNQTNFSIDSLAFGDYTWNVWGCGNSSNNTNYCHFAVSNYSFSRNRFTENNVSYNATTISASLEGFILNTTLADEIVSSSAILYYNNTAYASTKTVYGVHTFFTNEIIVPSIQTAINKTFYWTLNLDGVLTNSTLYNQTINPVSIDDCTSYGYQILNFSLFDEDLRIRRLNGTIELIVDLLNSERTITIGSFNQSYFINDTNAKTATVCFENINSTMSLDYQAKYFSNTSDYVVEYKFAQAISINNNTQTQNINLYNLLDARSTAFTIILQNPDLSTIERAIVDVQRQYIPINQFISVESPITNNLGEAISHLVHNEIYYNFVVSKDGELLGTFNNYLVQCQNYVTGDCRIYLNLIESTPSMPEFDEFGNITGSFVWTPSTRILLFNFVSTDGVTHNVSWRVLKLDNWGNNTICLNEITSTAGTLSCTIPVLWGNSTILASVYSDGEFLGHSPFSLQPTPESIFGGTRVVLAILMYCTLALLFFEYPPMVIIGAMLGMISVTSFRLIDGGTLLGNGLIVLWFIIAGGIIIHYIKDKT